MRKVLRIDNEGYFLGDVILKNKDIIPSDCIETHCQDGLYKPKWNGIEWVEGLSNEEINKLINTPVDKSEIEILIENQKLIQKALDDILLGGAL